MASTITDLTKITTLANAQSIAVQSSGESTKRIEFSDLKNQILSNKEIGGSSDIDIATVGQTLARGLESYEDEIVLYNSTGNAKTSGIKLSGLEPKDLTLMRTTDLSDAIDSASSTTPASSKAVDTLRQLLFTDYSTKTVSATLAGISDNRDFLSLNMSEIPGVSVPLGRLTVEYIFYAPSDPEPSDFTGALTRSSLESVVTIEKKNNGDDVYESARCNIKYRYKFVGLSSETAWSTPSVVLIQEPFRLKAANVVSILANADPDGDIDQQNAQKVIDAWVSSSVTIPTVLAKFTNSISQTT